MLDNKDPSIPLDEFVCNENRFATTKNNYTEKGIELLVLANEAMKQRWERIQSLKDL